MGDAVLGRTTKEKDLGILFRADMKASEQCGISVSKGNQIIGLIRRTITYKETQVIVPLYKSASYITASCSPLFRFLLQPLSSAI